MHLDTDSHNFLLIWQACKSNKCKKIQVIYWLSMEPESYGAFRDRPPRRTQAVWWPVITQRIKHQRLQLAEVTFKQSVWTDSECAWNSRPESERGKQKKERALGTKQSRHIFSYSTKCWLSKCVLIIQTHSLRQQWLITRLLLPAFTQVNY